MSLKEQSMDETILEIIGSVVVAIILIAIPICVSLSFVYDWYGGIKMFLIVATMLELFGLVNLITKHNY